MSISPVNSKSMFARIAEHSGGNGGYRFENEAEFNTLWQKYVEVDRSGAEIDTEDPEEVQRFTDWVTTTQA